MAFKNKEEWQAARDAAVRQGQRMSGTRDFHDWMSY